MFSAEMFGKFLITAVLEMRSYYTAYDHIDDLQ